MSLSFVSTFHQDQTFCGGLFFFLPTSFKCSHCIVVGSCYRLGGPFVSPEFCVLFSKPYLSVLKCLAQESCTECLDGSSELEGMELWAFRSWAGPDVGGS